MGFFLLIIFVLFCVGLSRMNSRISRLEQLLEGKELVKNGSVPPKQSSVSEMQTPTPRPAEPVVATTPAVSEESAGRILGRIGIGAVFIGVVFFLKYAFDNNWINETGRVAIGIVAGLVFIGVGQYLRKNYLKYSDLLMGGGVAILYLSVFSAYSFYHLIDPVVAFGFMAVVTIGTIVISLANATISLAVIGILGGFITPFAVSSGTDDMLGVFAYITLLNLGILAISVFKKWQLLVYIGYAGTILVFTSWFVKYYNEADYLFPVFAFLTIWFLIYVTSPILRTIRSAQKADEGDFSLLGISAFIYALMVYSIFNPTYHEFVGFGSVILAAFYAVVALAANKFNPKDAALNIFLPGIAVVFLSVAVPLQVSGVWISIAWLIEAVMLYLVASFIQNRGFQVMGLIVYALGVFHFFIFEEGFSQIAKCCVERDFTPIFNTSFGILTLAIVAAYVIAYMYKKYGSVSIEIQKRGIVAFAIIANILTLYAFTTQITGHYYAEISKSNVAHQENLVAIQSYNDGYDDAGKIRQEAYSTHSEEIRSFNNQSNAWVSVLWALYATLLTVLGFAKRLVSARRLGIVLFFITAVKVFIDIWSLGDLYRILVSIAFGIIALVGSFMYAKYKDRLKNAL